MEMMDECIRRVQSCLKSDNFRQPLFINVNNGADVLRLKSELMGLNPVSVADFCEKEDVFPSLEVMLDQLPKIDEHTLLTDLIPTLELLGERELRRILSSLKSLTIHGRGKLVILCCGAVRYFDTHDPRFARRFIQIHGKYDIEKKAVFISPDLNFTGLTPKIHFLQNFLRNWETFSQESSETSNLYVITSCRKSDYPNAMLNIAQGSAYILLTQNDKHISTILREDLGTPEQWRELLQKYSSTDKVGPDYIRSELGTDTDMVSLIRNWNIWDEQKRWLFFVLLKVNTDQKSDYLFRAAASANSSTELVRCIYREILKIKPDDSRFLSEYNMRKNLLMNLGNPEVEARDFCKLIRYMEANAVYYLTDQTQSEKEALLTCFNDYNYSQEILQNICRCVCPAIAEYMGNYHISNSGLPLDDYFQRYKIQKITNHIDPTFEAVVDQQAKTREYNRSGLPSRSSVIEKLGDDQTIVYYIDALGIEFLGYIQARCQAYGLMTKITVCRANIPTITSENREFVEEFQGRGIEVVTVKELDEIKHHGKEDFDYEKTKLPLHLLRELEIIDSILKKIAGRIGSDERRNVLIVSDHGASRLAVIRESTVSFEVDSKGIHGGRCCVYDETLPTIETATIENGFYVLAGYDRFKGGRKASVETHGGATLEEILVPVIEVTHKVSEIEISFPEDTITVDYKKCATIRMYSKASLTAVSMSVNQKTYYACQDGLFWIFQMPDLKKPGKYIANIYEKQNFIGQLYFRIVKRVANEKDMGL